MRGPIFGAIGAMVVLALLLSRAPASPAANAYIQTNLLSDNGVPGTKTDSLLQNPWGMAFFGGEPFWINDEVTGVSELIDGQGNIMAGLPFVTIPPPPGVTAPPRPTGIVTNGTGEFVLPNGSAASFIFDSLDGEISGWNSGGAAVNVVDNSATARYTGLATAMIGGITYLYAANSAGGIDVFDGNFKPFTTTGGFVNPNPGLSPYGIAAIPNGDLIVTYAGLNGAVDEFTPQGVLVRSFTGGTLSQPWGVAMAPANFGAFSNDLLVGDLANSTITAFNPSSGVS